MDKKKADKNSLKHKFIASLAEIYLRITGITTRIIKKSNDKEKEFEKTRRNFIYALWHNQQAFLIYAYRFKKVCAMVSMSGDGGYMAELLKNFGMKVVRGSTSKGGINAVLKLIDAAKQGYHPVLTPDGPRGPRQTVQTGILFLAQKTGLPIIPLTCHLKRKIVFKSWDKFELPLPFGKAIVVSGNPVTVKQKDDLKEKALELKTELDRISKLAKEMVK